MYDINLIAGLSLAIPTAVFIIWFFNKLTNSAISD